MSKVLITPLDWGLGHATRCVPIIHELLSRNCTVFIAGCGDSLTLLKKEFPFLTSFILPEYRPVYSSTKSLVWTMVRQIPKFIRVIQREHVEVESIIQKNKIDIIISDNRYGCWSRRIPSIFITHQLNILMPKGFGWLSQLVRLYNYRLIKRFSWCWVPDYADEDISLSGMLTSYDKKSLKHVLHIGPLSRFKPMISEIKYDVLCIFSGPEPQRTLFEKLVMGQLKNSGLKYFVVRGIFSEEDSLPNNEVAFLNSEALQVLISQSSLVVARSGYTTIMDLAALGKKAIVVPTPGQTEQAYLATRWSKRGILYATMQDCFNLQHALTESKSRVGFSIYPESKELLHQALDKAFQQANKF